MSKMKMMAFLLIGLLGLNSLEAITLLSRTSQNPKTCCGRSICTCKHAKGAHCPFKHKLGHQHVERTTQERTPSFKSSPCHRNESKTAAPSYAKEFCLEDTIQAFILQSHNKNFVIENLKIHVLIDHSLDKPPQNL